MSIPDKLNEYIKNDNIRAIRIMLKNRIISDPTFKEFDKLDNYVRSNSNIDIYEKHDGNKFETDEVKWNEDYINKQYVELIINFSEDRVNHLRDVCKVVYKGRLEELNSMDKNKIHNQKKIDTIATENGVNSVMMDTTSKTNANIRTYASTTKGKSTIAALGSSVALATGIIIEKTAIVVGGALIAVGGLALIVLDKKLKK